MTPEPIWYTPLGCLRMLQRKGEKNALPPEKTRKGRVKGDPIYIPGGLRTCSAVFSLYSWLTYVFSIFFNTRHPVSRSTVCTPGVVPLGESPEIPTTRVLGSRQPLMNRLRATSICDTAWLDRHEDQRHATVPKTSMYQRACGLERMCVALDRYMRQK